MKTKELLEQHPLSTEIIRKWFFNEMITSIQDAQEVPEEFKEAMLQEGVTNERLAILINAQPRTLFDVFDENDIIIQIIPIKEDKVKYLSKVNQFETPYDFTRPYFIRKKAEHDAIEKAFKILEERLTPIEFPKLKE